jgi:outer membrane protein OmpA-like peptidoglycan-associated protein
MKSFLSIGLLFFAVSYWPARAGEPSKEEIVCALDPTCAAQNQGPRTRGLTVSGQEPSLDPFSINLHITFAYNSAEILTDGKITLDTLGAALRDTRLAKFTFLIGGHTDAKGSDVFNQALSERRANAVRAYLINNYRIPAAQLTVKGYGRLRLFDPGEPFSAVNRRVQIVNMSAASAGR